MSNGVETEHPEYARRKDEWLMLRDVLAGSRAVKARGELHLPRLVKQAALAYADYLMRAKFYAATPRTLDALKGIIFHKPMVVEGPAHLLDQLTDITLADLDIQDFTEALIKEVIGMGRYGVLVDMPDGANPEENRPYWVGYRTEQITNWRETAAHGETYPTLVVLKETYETEVDAFEMKEHEQYRVLELIPHPLVSEADGGKAYVQRIWQKVMGADGKESKDFAMVKEIIPMKQGVPLSFLPFQAFGPTSLGLCPENPPLSEMAETNLHMYRRSADLEHGRHFTGLPTPVITGMPAQGPGTPQTWSIGSAEAWLLPIGADAKFLEFTGQGLGALENGIAEDKDEMAALGSEMFAPEPDAPSAVETATAVRVRHSGKTATLKTMARRVGSGVTNCMQWQAWWDGDTTTPDDAAIFAKVNEIYLDVTLSSDDIKALVLAVQAGTISGETMYEQLKKGELTRPGVTWEQEKKAIDEETAAAGAQAADDAKLMAEAVPPAPVVTAGVKAQP